MAKKRVSNQGHKGHFRTLLPTDQVDYIRDCKLPSHCSCGGEIKSTDDTVCHQVYELPVLKLHISEYQLQQGCCAVCRGKHVAPLPEGVTWGITGPRLTSFMSELTAKYGLSRSAQKLFLKEMFNFAISKGTVF